MELRDYQKLMIDDARAAMRDGCKRILITAPTGSGKTVMFAHMASKSSERGRPAWIVVHRKELVTQTLSTLGEFGITANVVASGMDRDNGSPITVVMVQTAVKRLTALRPPSLIIWDECHHIVASSYLEIFSWAKSAFHLGLTATPVRLDGTGLRQCFDRMVVGPTVGSLIDQGHLSKYRMFCPSKVDLRGLRKSMGDWRKSDLEALTDKPTITGSAITEYKKLCPGATSLVFASTIAHSNHVSEEFNNAGIPARHVDANTPRDEREASIRDLREGRLRVICNVDLFGEGIDLPGLVCTIMLRPTASTGLYMQQVGRTLRTAPGKEQAIILDHVGNCSRHGLPDDERCWSLDGLPKRSRRESDADDPGVRICSECFAANPARATTCCACGSELKASAREIAIREGKLEEMKRDRIRIENNAARRACRDLPSLIAHGQAMGYKNPYWWAVKVLEGRERQV
jgi:DNA repair protein RadD